MSSVTFKSTINKQTLTLQVDENEVINFTSSDIVLLKPIETNTAFINEIECSIVSTNTLITSNLSLSEINCNNIFVNNILTSDIVNVACGGIETARLSANQVQVSKGSSGAPGLSFLNDTDTGIYSSGSDIVNVACSNINIAQFSSSNITFQAPLDSSYQSTFQMSSALLSAQSFANATETIVLFGNTSLINTNNRGSGVSYATQTFYVNGITYNPGTFTISTAGFWFVSWRIPMLPPSNPATNASYSCYLKILSDNSRRMWCKHPTIGGGETIIVQSTDIIYFETNTRFTLSMFQSTGSSVTNNISHPSYITLYKIP